MRKISFGVLLFFLCTCSFAQPIVRVRLFDGKGKLSSITLCSSNPIAAALPEGSAKAESWNVQATASGMILEGNEEKFVLTDPLEFWVECSDSEVGLITVKAGAITRTYRGRITVSLLPQDKGLLVVNSLPQEEYLYGVVPNEVPASWPKTALEAQAILARTYSFGHLNPKKEYDLVDSTNSQVYLGYDSEKPSTNRAVDDTANLVVGYGGKPVPYVYYFSTCGGQTEDSGQIWGTSVPYLVPVSCSGGQAQDLSSSEAVANFLAAPSSSYCSRSPASRWEVRLTSSDLAPLLAANFPEGAELLDLAVTRRSPGGGALEVAVITDKGELKISGELNIRRSLKEAGQALRSSFFAVDKLQKEDGSLEFLLRGGGWGHRVGVCQWAMEGMARQGASCHEILSHFLPGTELIAIGQESLSDSELPQ